MQVKSKFIYAGFYSVTNTGEVYSHFFRNRQVTKRREKPLKLKQFIGNGYYRVTICMAGKEKSILSTRQILWRCKWAIMPCVSS